MYIKKPKGMRYKELIGKRIKIHHFFRGKPSLISEGFLEWEHAHSLGLKQLDGTGLLTFKPFRKGGYVEVWNDG